MRDSLYSCIWSGILSLPLRLPRGGGRELGVGRRLEDDGKFHLPGVPPALPLFPFASLQTARAHTVKAAQKRPQLRTEPTLLGGKWRGRWGWLQEGNLKNVFLSFVLLFCDPLGNLCGDRGAMLTSVFISPLQKSPWSNEIHLRCRDHVLYMDCGYHNSYSIGAKLGLQLRKPYL